MVFAPVPGNLRYVDPVLRVACSGDSSSGLLEVVRSRDEATRARMIELVRLGWPQGEALNKAWSEHELRWVAPPQKRVLDDVAPQPSSPDKKLRTATFLTGQAICKRNNDN